MNEYKKMSTLFSYANITLWFLMYLSGSFECLIFLFQCTTIPYFALYNSISYFIYFLKTLAL